MNDAATGVLPERRRSLFFLFFYKAGLYDLSYPTPKESDRNVRPGSPRFCGTPGCEPAGLIARSLPTLYQTRREPGSSKFSVTVSRAAPRLGRLPPRRRGTLSDGKSAFAAP